MGPKLALTTALETRISIPPNVDTVCTTKAFKKILQQTVHSKTW